MQILPKKEPTPSTLFSAALATGLIPSKSFSCSIYPLKTNAQLRGEQRLHPHLKHCAINTKFEVEAKMPSVVNPS
ncbi:TPA: hypothetical protein I7747_21800 [Vibrio vulnificus]|nr:hypothetical protein [Vibrio vulnificus]